jgi:PTH1 family peptidyl-tRNA hydrolase
MYLVVGLGNPGAEYAATRHNIGWLALDAIAREYGASAWSKKFSGEVSECTAAGEKLLLLKPHTFMNLSGKSVQAATAFYKLPLDHVIVLQDEIDLPLAKLRIKKGGGANGHNGIRDIDQMIGPDYWRLRLGVGHPGTASQVHGHVLSSFAKDERKPVAEWLEKLAKELPLFWTHSPAALMSKLSPPPVRAKKDKTDDAPEAKATASKSEKE